MRQVPCELPRNFEPRFPLVLGGLLSGEERLGLVSMRVKKHRWQRGVAPTSCCRGAVSEPPPNRPGLGTTHKKVLKSQDPLTFSVGWRRFQSLSARAAGRAGMRTTERHGRAFFTGAASGDYLCVAFRFSLSVWVFLFIGMRCGVVRVRVTSNDWIQWQYSLMQRSHSDDTQ